VNPPARRRVRVDNTPPKSVREVPLTMVPLFIVDAFTDRAFSGNPASICLLDEWPSDAWLAQVAAEMNHSETAFVTRRAECGFQLRWFTPAVEVALCGHATLAAAAVLWHAGWAPPDDTIHFATLSGVLTAARRGPVIELDFPLKPVEEASPPPGLLESLGVRATFVGRSQFDYLVEVDSEETLQAVVPDFRQLATVECRGVIVTAVSSRPDVHFVSRFFAPAAGVDEDPVTGSAHCTLADHWRRRLGRDEFRARQVSQRGGELEVCIRGQRVLLRGAATIVLTGQFSDAACASERRFGV
jgi:predicted PhzF superfamily epimerase YddE/YHI9